MVDVVEADEGRWTGGREEMDGVDGRMGGLKRLGLWVVERLRPDE